MPPANGPNAPDQSCSLAGSRITANYTALEPVALHAPRASIAGDGTGVLVYLGADRPSVALSTSVLSFVGSVP